MASDPQSATATETATATKIKLEPPEALQPISVQEAAGLVPLKSEETSELDNKVAKFVDAFFSKFDELQKPPRHPKWREVNFAATLEGWRRSPAAQAWINRAKQGTSTASKSNFDTFLAQNAGRSGAPVSDEQRAELFKAFLEWNKNQQ